jgi:solute carrier family 25 protein 16
LNKIGEEKGLAIEAKDILLGILVYEEDEEDEDSIITSNAVSKSLMDVWLHNNVLAMKDSDGQAQFIEGQLQIILLAFGRKRPKVFLTTINKFFVQKDCRILILLLLCEFIRHQPPHLHQLLQTPLFDNLLKCLQIDTSTRVISLAMTALIMFLPHIPSSLATHLPALFNIYSRMLFWDRERRAISEPELVDDESEKSEPPLNPVDDGSWAKLSYLLESEDENVPELLHYFTFLYGLYPLNFMSYIRKPQRYLRHADFPGADDLDVEPTEIRQRSEPFRQVHLMHPNFFIMTIESELTDNNRWMRSEAADVVAECMALFSPGDESHTHPSRPRGPDPYRMIELNADVPEEPLLDGPGEYSYQSRHASWRNTQSTAVASPDGCRTSVLLRKTSQTSQSMPSIADSPSLRASERLDSPTLPASQTPLQDMLNSQKSARGSLYQSLTNDSTHSLSDSHNPQDNSFHVDAYLQSLTRDRIPRSPSVRPTCLEPSVRVAYLHREIQLLRNDLNFERYLKQQHLSHIGQLRRKQLREARVEAETQNLIDSNRGLKSKIGDAKKSILQMKKEGEKSKNHSRKWEENLSSKLRILREEQKKWSKEKEELEVELGKFRGDTTQLRNLVVAAEARELGSEQKMQSIDSSLDESERLRGEVDKLTLSLRTFEAGEIDSTRAKEAEELALRKVEVLEGQLRARDHQLMKSKLAFEAELRELKQSEDSTSTDRNYYGVTNEILDAGLAASRNRIVELQKTHNHLLKRYTALQDSYMNLREQFDLADDLSESPPLLTGGSASAMRPRFKQNSTSRPDSPTLKTTEIRRRNHTMSDADLDAQHSPFSSLPGHGKSRRMPLDTSYLSRTPDDTRSPVLGNAAQGAAQYHFGLGPGSGIDAGAGRGSGSFVSDEFDSAGNLKPKIKPQSEVRVYGRGMLFFFHRSPRLRP